MNTSARVTVAPSEAAQKILDLLVSVTETEEVRSNLDLSLYDSHVIEQEFGIQVSPAEFDRESWATPRKIVADIQRRLHE